MKFFRYDQNNSGGVFSKTMPLTLWVEAKTAEEADFIAERHGVYFDGVEDDIDCGCCGDRWSRAYGKGEDAPRVDADTYGFDKRCAERCACAVRVIKADGTTEDFS